jgi:uncharacterized protein
MMKMIDGKARRPLNTSFLDAMKGNRAGIWPVFLAIALIVSVWSFPFVTRVLSSFMPPSTARAQDEALVALLWLLGSFAPALLIIVLWRRFIERQPWVTLMTVGSHFRWRLLVASALVVGGLGLVITVLFDALSVAHMQERFAKFSIGDWLLLTLAYGVGIGVQACFEELFVRGWLFQHIGRIVPNALGVVVVTSVVFAAMHFRHHGWATYVFAFTFGLAFGWSVVRLNGLEAALGAHVANNLTGALLAGQMMTGNPPALDDAQLVQLFIYVLGFLVFVEVWARFFAKPTRD